MTLAWQVRLNRVSVVTDHEKSQTNRDEGTKEMRKQKGFSLIELLIVVAIILILSC